MRLWPKSLKWRTILLTLLGLVAVGVSVWWTFRADIAVFVRQQKTLSVLRNSPHALDRAVGNGELRVGVSVDEWAAAHPPRSRCRHDEYDTLMYEGNHRYAPLRVIAVDGVIVFAGTDITDPLVGVLSSDESAAYFNSLKRWSARRIAGLTAVSGVAGSGSLDRWSFPTPHIDDLRIAP